MNIRGMIPAALIATLFAIAACGTAAPAKPQAPVKPAKPVVTEDMMPDPVLDPDVFPIFSDAYRGGLKIDRDSKLYIWNGCRITTETEDYWEPTDYWKIAVNPGIEWFGWGIHHHPSGGRDMSGFENGYLHMAFKARPRSGPVKIGIKSGYVTESWIALTNGEYGVQYDDNWHVVKIPFRDFIPKIDMGSINAFFLFSQQVAPAVTGSIYYIDALVWVKNSNAEYRNVQLILPEGE